jgi:cytosine/uracil/thiamine/allantoin permease
VLLYGTAMTIGAFAYLSGGWAILAMLVVWLSTLGLYVLMVLVGLAGAALGLPGRLSERIREFRS